MTNSAKRKGSEFERSFARSMPRAKRTPLSGASGGGDISFAAGEELWADWSWELKRRKTLPVAVTAALQQASSDIGIGDRRHPAVAMREDGGRTIVVMWWDDLRPWVEAIASVGRAGRVRDLGRELERIAHELRATR